MILVIVINCKSFTVKHFRRYLTILNAEIKFDIIYKKFRIKLLEIIRCKIINVVQNINSMIY